MLRRVEKGSFSASLRKATGRRRNVVDECRFIPSKRGGNNV